MLKYIMRWTLFQLVSEEVSIAGLLGWTITFSESDKESNAKITKGNFPFVYNENVGKIGKITCLYDSTDQSQYDYLGDFNKVFETAKLDRKHQL